MQNMLQLQDDLKNFSEQQLVREMQMPSGQVPQFLILTELGRRKRIKDDFTRQQAANAPTVAEETVAAAGMPVGEATGIAKSMAPKTSMAENTGIGTMMPRQPTRMAGGGVVKMAPGGSVGMPVEPFPANSPNPRDRSEWMANYKNTHNLDGSPKFLSPDLAMQGGIESLSADVGDYFPPNMRMQTQDKMAGAVSPDRRVPRSSLPILASPEDQDVVRGPKVEAAMETQNVLEAMMKANQGIARDETPTGQLNADALGNILGFNPEDPAVSRMVSQLGAVTEDAPFTEISPSNIEALITNGEIGSGFDQSVRDTLPKSVRENELRRSRGTATVGSATDLAVPQRETTDPVYDMFEDAKRIPLDPDFGPPTLDTDAPAGPISMPIGNKGGIYSLDEQGNVVGGNQSYGARFGFTPSIDEPVGATQEAIDSAEEAAKIREAQGITDASGSVGALLAAGDKAAAQEIITEARKAAKKDEETPDSDGDDDTPKPDPDLPGGGGVKSALSGELGGTQGELAKYLKDMEKSRDQDKWLALAKTGLALMASKQPTLGGAIGEAGMTGMKDLQTGKKAYSKDKMAILALQQRIDAAKLAAQTSLDVANIRAAAAGKGSASSANTTNRVMLKELLGEVNKELEQLIPLSGGAVPAENLDRYNELVKQRTAILTEMEKLTTLPTLDDTDATELAGVFDVPTKP